MEPNVSDITKHTNNVAIKRTPDGKTEGIIFDDNDTNIIKAIVTMIGDVIKTIITSKK